jgi:hypothetical protein
MPGIAVHAGSLVGSLKEACRLWSNRPQFPWGAVRQKMLFSGVAATGDGVIAIRL